MYYIMNYKKKSKQRGGSVKQKVKKIAKKAAIGTAVTAGTYALGVGALGALLHHLLDRPYIGVTNLQ